MTDAATRPAAAPGLPSALAVGAGVALGLTTALLLRIRTTPDVDLYLHLRIGDLLDAGERFGAGPDPLATLADRPYFPTQWLAQRAMAWTWSAAGMNGIQVVRLLLVICLGAAVAAACRLLAPTAASGFAAALAMFGAATAWGERPQLAGLVVFAVVTLLWWRSTLEGAVPWVVVPLTWLWACLHGTWTLGIGAGVVLLVGAVADGRLTRREAWRGALVLLGSVLAAAITPLGPRLLIEPFRVGNLASEYVNEWARPAADNPILWAVVMAAALAGIGVVRSADQRWTRLACLVAGLALALWMVRTMAFGAVLMAPAAAHGLATLGRRNGTSQSEWAVWAIALVTVLMVGGWHLVNTPFDSPVTPQLSDAIAHTPADLPLAVDGLAVGWVQWAHRDRRPMYDLRAEVYSERVSTAYRSFADAEPGWEAYAAQQGIVTILAERDSRLDTALEKAGRWAVAAEDGDFRLWRRSATTPAEATP